MKIKETIINLLMVASVFLTTAFGVQAIAELPADDYSESGQVDLPDPDEGEVGEIIEEQGDDRD